MFLLWSVLQLFMCARIASGGVVATTYLFDCAPLMGSLVRVFWKYSEHCWLVPLGSLRRVFCDWILEDVATAIQLQYA